MDSFSCNKDKLLEQGNLRIQPRILFLFETAAGLGHMRRASGIVNALIDKGANVTVASGTFVNPQNFFSPKAHLARLEPLVRKKGNSHFSYDEAGNMIPVKKFNQEEWEKKRASQIQDVLRDSPVHAIMVEYWPFSRQRAFNRVVSAAIKTVNRQGVSPIVISSARDVLHARESIRDGREKIVRGEQSAVKIVREKVDYVFVHGDPRVVAFSDGFSLHKKIARKISYTGYVVNEEAKDRHAPREKTVIVSAGSGSSGFGILKSVFNAHALCEDLKDHEWVFILGPRMPENQKNSLVKLFERHNEAGSGRPILFHHFVTDLPNRLSRADFSISMGGYNTTLEVLASGAKGIIIPKMLKNGDGTIISCEEQAGRARRLQEQGLLSVIEGNILQEASGLAAKIDDAYRKNRTVPLIDFNGAEKTADMTLAAIRKRFRNFPAEFFSPEYCDVSLG